MKRIAFISLLLIVGATGSSHAETGTGLFNTELKSTLDASSELKMTEEDKSLARQWQLTDSDWLKYKSIMKGPRGVWSPGLDPITALGVSETNLAERKRYAELWIKVETKRAELEIAFEVERQLAAKRINGDQLAVKNQQWVQEWEEKRTAVSKQVFLFVDVKCIDDCKALVDEVRASVGKNARLDIFFANSATSEAIGQWAASMKISPETVRSKSITLNFDEGKSSSLKVDLKTLPQVRVVDTKTGSVTSTFK